MKNQKLLFWKCVREREREKLWYSTTNNGPGMPMGLSSTIAPRYYCSFLDSQPIWGFISKKVRYITLHFIYHLVSLHVSISITLSHLIFKLLFHILGKTWDATCQNPAWVCLHFYKWNQRQSSCCPLLALKKHGWRHDKRGLIIT